MPVTGVGSTDSCIISWDLSLAATHGIKWKVGWTCQHGPGPVEMDGLGDFYLRHVELVEDLGAEFDTVLMFRLDHSEETEINDQSRVECGGNISVRKRIAVDLVCC